MGLVFLGSHCPSPLAWRTQLPNVLGVEPPSTAAVHMEAGGRKRAGCPREAKRGSCGLIFFGRMPWRQSSVTLDPSIQSCLGTGTVDMMGGQLDH